MGGGWVLLWMILAASSTARHTWINLTLSNTSLQRRGCQTRVIGGSL